MSAVVLVLKDESTLFVICSRVLSMVDNWPCHRPLWLS
jgi:hypothetical protein